MQLRISVFVLFALLLAVGCSAQSTVAPASKAAATAPAAAQTSAATAAPAASTQPAASISDNDALALANKFYDLFVTQQDYARAAGLFDDQMKAALPDSKLKEIWETLPKQVGAFQNRSDAQLAERKDPYQRVIIPLQFEKAALNMLVVVDVTTGKISGLFFQPAEAATPAASSTQPAATLSGADAVALANEFYDLFVTQQDYAGAVSLFDTQVKAALPDSKLKELGETLPKQVGALQNRSEAQLAEREFPYQQVVIPVQYEKAALNMIVTINVITGKISGLLYQPNQAAEGKGYKTPTYVDTSKFAEKDVTFGSAPWQLPGTLTLPTGEGPFPAVVLVHGSGTNDRDETIGPNKPFKDIAQGLASQGIAVLRYDKRTKVYPLKTSQLQNITVKEEFIDDAAAAVEFLQSQPGIDPKQIYVAGHSEGGYVAPRIAEAAPSLAGLIILAGPTRPLEDVIQEQVRYLLESDGSFSAEDQAQLQEVQKQVETVKALTQTLQNKPILGFPVSYLLDLKDYHPAEVARSLTIPLLILQGERDYQVTMQDFVIWQKVLAGRPNVELKSYPDLNHLFITGTGKSVPAEYQTPGNVAPAVIQDIASWIQQRH